MGLLFSVFTAKSCHPFAAKDEKTGLSFLSVH